MIKITIKVLLLNLALLLTTNTFAQNGNILWQQSYGGSNYDSWSSLVQDADSNIITVTWSNSTDNYINTNYGDYDILCLKINQNGDTIFSKNYGSYANDSPVEIITAIDSGYIIMANTNDTNKTKGGFDIWLIKIDTNGDTLWTKTYGGSSDEFANDLIKTNDNNYLISLSSKSNDGDFTNNQGGYDAWVIKVDINGNIIWKKSYSGSLDEKTLAIANTFDNGYILGIRSKSSDGDFNINYGDYDIFIKKIDNSGSTQWTKHIGGSDFDDIDDIIEVQNNYYLFGSTYSNDSDIVNNHGAWDILAIKLNDNGNIIWQKCFGGSLNDDVKKTINVNNTFVIAGSSKSTDGDLTNNKGESDAWVINVDTSGTILWQKNYGGTNNDEATEIIKTLDGNLMFCANSSSNNIDLTNNFGSYDLWLVKIFLSSTVNLKNNYNNNDITIYPNPTSGKFKIKTKSKITEIRIYDILGKEIIKTNNPAINISTYKKGLYFIKINTINNVTTKKIILK